MTTSTKLAQRQTVSGIIAKRDAVLERIQQAVDLLREADATAKEIGPYCTPWNFRGDIEDAVHWYERHGINNLRRELDRGVWRVLLNISGLRELMDREAREKFEKELRDDPPPVTGKTVGATFRALYQDRDEIFRRSVCAIAQRLSRNYQSNQGALLNKKIVLAGAFCEHRWGGWNHWSKRDSDVRDLDRVFRILDGASTDTQGQDVADALSHARRVAGDGRAAFENDYMAFQVYRNGNLHITFKRLDLLKKANRIIAGEIGPALEEAA